MTDNEIIKVLECCRDCKCKDCPCYNKETDGCKELDEQDILDLINRQKAEIKRLREENEIKNSKRANIFEITNAYGRGKIAGRKEFAERLKTETFLAKEKGSVEHTLWIDEIDNLLKEMEGEE